MARINMEEILEELDEKFALVLAAVVTEIVPDREIDRRNLLRLFRSKLERGFARWERVSDRCVDAD